MALTAHFHGVCIDCGETIIPGQQIRRDDTDEGWQHHSCGERPARVECVCEKCWLVHAGECA